MENKQLIDVSIQLLETTLGSMPGPDADKVVRSVIEILKLMK